MAVGYGSNFPLEQLSSEQVGKYIDNSGASFWDRFGGWILTAVEVGALFIPVAGEAISATIAATQASVTTVKQAQSGNINILDLGLQWGGAAIGGLGAGVGIAKGAAGAAARDPLVKLLDEGIKTGSQFQKAGLEAFRSEVPGFLKAWKDPASVGKFFGTRVTKELNKAALQGPLARLVNPLTKLEHIGVKGFEKGITVGLRKGASIGAEVTTDATDDLARNVRQAEAKISSTLTKEEYETFLGLVSTSGTMSVSRFRFLLSRFISTLDPAKVAILRQESKILLNSNSVKRLFLTAGNQPRGIKIINSSKFYQNEVQWVQNINGSDMGRYIAERGYHSVKTKIDEWARQLKQSKWFKKFSEAIKIEGGAEQAFIKSGGVGLNSSYLLGYKILSSQGKGHWQTHEVLVKFRKGTTSSKTGKNKGGKKDIIISATSQDLERLVAEGSTYWFAKGASKGWFMSRGGREISNSVPSSVANILSFLPIQAIRTLGSMISNVKAFTQNFSGGFVAGLEKYGEEVAKNFKNTGINRAGRILSRSGVGAIGGKWAGRAAQQLTTAGINSLTKGKNFKSTLVGTSKSKFGGSLIGKRLLSDVKRGTYKGTGKRAQALTGGRKLQITSSARGWGSW